MEPQNHPPYDFFSEICLKIEQKHKGEPRQFFSIFLQKFIFVEKPLHKRKNQRRKIKKICFQAENAQKSTIFVEKIVNFVHFWWKIKGENFLLNSLY